MKEEKETLHREFKLSSLALKNKNTIYLLTGLLLFFGIYSYTSLPKELFPEVYYPTIMVHTPYPGNPPLDMENLITRPLEKEIDRVKGLKKITSTSSQDISAIFVEFTPGIEIKTALNEVKDAVDKSKSELPDDMPTEPIVSDIDFSEFPVINVNIFGDYSVNELKRFAEFIEDELEDVDEISKVEIKGITEREIKINVDLHQMEAKKISFNDVETAIASENLSMSGGELKISGTMRSIRVIGEFTNMQQIEDVIVKSEDNNIVYLKDIAEVVYGYKDLDSYARLNKQSVVSLQVVKKSGENLLSAIDHLFEKIEIAQQNGTLPNDLSITYTNDQSEMVRSQLSNLENSLILGIILVILVLFFFLGTRNSLFVGFAIPMSMFLAFVVFNFLDYRINMIILFGLILALGMLVDNAIVVVENIYRFVSEGYTKKEAARLAVGEIAVPIISSTATTLVAFLPLLFWDSLMGEFMKFLPITLIIVLTSSLFVALVIVPVFASTFMKMGAEKETVNAKKAGMLALVLSFVSILAYLMGWNIFGGLAAFFAVIGLMNILFLNRIGIWFKDVLLVWLENLYEKVIHFAIKKNNSGWFILGTVVLLFLTIGLLQVRSPKVVFFPSSYPSFINITAELPIGTELSATNEFMKKLEGRVVEVLEPNKQIVKSVLTTVGKGAVGENEGFNISDTPNKGLITVHFIDFEDRGDINTFDILKELGDELIGKYPSAFISVEKPNEGPPVGKPINIEISGKDFEELLSLTDSIQYLIEAENIPGIEGLKIDLNIGNPELLVHIDRDKARRFGLSTGQIAMTIRTALFGKDVSDYKEGEDEYPIQLRLQERFRNDISALMNQKITFRNQSNGRIVQVPISAVADIEYSSTYGAVKRKNLDRVITLYSNVLEGYNPTEINNQIKPLLAVFDMPDGYKYEFTGEQEEQAESMEFLMMALLVAVALIMIILVSQFNSVVKPAIIVASVIFSTIGVMGGIATFKMDFVVIMTGVGIVSLAGVVVNNAIVLLDYVDLLKKRKRKELGLEEDALLSVSDTEQCVEQAGKTRLRPVLLTAITTILGLIPMAIGLNINFYTALKDFDAQIFFGGDNAAFWGPISWTIIFGLTFATFLTLVIVPSMYQFLYKVKFKMSRISN
ncbi:MAG: efflux RND transporter permease subunit [Bacteroidales bacterium]|jgi:multidrug efflux pump|nr:efflux RND transporter permease subunit [Bacteroidales bacterium]